MEPDSKINEDLVTFMRKRSETGAPQYTAKIKTYLNIKQKRRRAAAARRHARCHHYDTKAVENSDRRGVAEEKIPKKRSDSNDAHRPRSLTRSRSDVPQDACRPPRKRRRRSRQRCGCSRRRRRRSRRRRRRSSRRRRSCSRRRRRRSARRRRRRRRRRCG